MNDEEIKYLRNLNKELLTALEKIQAYYNDYSLQFIPIAEIRDLLKMAIKKAKGGV